MENRIFFVVYLVMLLSEGSTVQLISQPNYNNFQSLERVLMYIMQTCGKKYDVIVMHQSGNESFTKAVLNSELVSTIILHEDSAIIRKKSNEMKKLDAIVIIKKSYKQLKNTIKAFSKTSWWNVLTPYFILDEAIVNNHTADILKTFKFFLKKDILTTYLIKKNNSSIDVMTVNPFAKWAPLSWKFFATLKTQSTIYTRLFDPDVICNGFHFDRTQYINGHKINMFNVGGIYPFIGEFIIDEKSIDGLLTNVTLVSITALRDVLKLKINTYIHTSPPHYYSLMSPKYVYEQTDIGIIFHPYIKSNNSYFDPTLPSIFRPLNLLINRVTYVPLYQKIEQWYKIILFGISVLHVIAIIIYFMFHKNSLSFYKSKIPRFNCAYSEILFMYHDFNYKTIIVFLFFIHMTFFGSLVKSFIKSDLSRDIETLDDFKNSKYKNIWYGPKSAKYIEALEINDKEVKYDDDPSCEEILSHSKPTVHSYSELDLFSCFSPHYPHISTDDFYILAKPFGFHYESFYIRRQWSLNSRINKFFANIFEASLNHPYNKCFSFRYNRLKSALKPKDKINIKPIDLNTLTFAFVILGIGLIVATICFFLENLFLYNHVFKIK